MHLGAGLSGKLGMLAVVVYIMYYIACYPQFLQLTANDIVSVTLVLAFLI